MSGIRSTGNLHLGNYFGAVKNFVKMQHENRCFVADYHALTTHPKPENLHDNIKKVLSEYLAAGLDPEVATLYIQSDVPEIMELYLLLNMNAYVGELERTTTFKEKVRNQPENVNAGLLTYPVLMCSDIIVHLEMARKFAKRFNHMYGVEYFTLPEPYNFGEELIKVPGLDGTGKMGKSEGNGIYLADDPEVIRKKVMRAVSDAGPQKPNSPMSEPVANLFYLLELLSAPDTVKHFRDSYNDCSIRYGDLKKQLAEDIISFTSPIRERINDIYLDSDYLRKVVKMGAEKARESASKTVREVREILGYKPF